MKGYNSKQYQEYLDRIQEFIYSGKRVERVVGRYSLFRAGLENIRIYSGGQEAETYPFRIKPEYYTETDYFILICCNDICAFKIPTSVLKEWNLTAVDQTGRYLVDIRYNNDNWWVGNRNINEYYFNLKRDNEKTPKSIKKDREILLSVLGLREKLGIK